MKNPIYRLTQGVYDLLDGAGYSVHDGIAANGAIGTYIVMLDRSCNQSQGKSGFTFEANFTLDIVVKNDNLGYAAVEQIVDEVLELFIPDDNSVPIDLSAFDLDVDEIRLVNLSNIATISDTQKIFRNLVNFEFKISQIN